MNKVLMMPGGCGLFNFMGKKEEDIVNVEEKQSLMEALHHTHSNSSSSSDDEEVEEGSTGEKKRDLKRRCPVLTMISKKMN